LVSCAVWMVSARVLASKTPYLMRRDLPSAHDMYISLLPTNEGGLEFAKDKPEGVEPKWQVAAAFDR
jgi:hypothetical protein